MEKYNIMTASEAKHTDRYNDAIETIWDLQQRLYDERMENEHLWQAYEELQDKLFG